MAEFTETSGTPFLNPFSIDKAAEGSPPEFPPAKDMYVFSGIDLADRRDWCAIAQAALRDVAGVRKIIVLACRVWKPDANGHKVLTILGEMGAHCQLYGSRVARGDQRSMSVAEQVLGQYGVAFTRIITEGRGSEQMYRTFSGLLNEHRIVLPNNPELLQQLRRLEEKTSDGNRFLVGGRRNSKDDLAVACVAAVAAAAEQFNSGEPFVPFAIFSNASGSGAARDRYANLAPNDCGPERWWHKLN